MKRPIVLPVVLHDKLRKDAEIDDIPAEVLKKTSLLTFYSKFINGCFNIGRIQAQRTSGIFYNFLTSNIG